jgi:hypothetical protein
MRVVGSIRRAWSSEQKFFGAFFQKRTASSLAFAGLCFDEQFIAVLRN